MGHQIKKESWMEISIIDLFVQKALFSHFIFLKVYLY